MNQKLTPFDGPLADLGTLANANGVPSRTWFNTMHLRARWLLIALICCLSISMAQAQISVTVTNGTNTTPNLSASYASLAAALTDLNAVTAMSGPVTLTLSGSETAPVKGFVLGSATLNPVLSATNTITLINSGTVTINAGVGTATPSGASPDGMFVINGADYVTIDGITFTDGNTTNPATMEFGIALFKRTAGDGSNFNTIQNCTFNMQRVNNASGGGPMVEGSVSIGVYNSLMTAAATSLTPTNGGTLATNGTNSNNKFYGNAVNGGNYGIVLNGFAASAGVGPAPNSSTFLGDLNNDIGGTSSSTGNTILNFGGAAAATNPSAGIRANNQWSINVSYNTVNNNNGSGVNHVTTLRGIFAQAGTSANGTISNNNVTIRGGGTTTEVNVIDVGIGSTGASNTVTITNNTVTGEYLTATSGIFRGINSSSTATTVNANNNTVQNITYSSASLTGSGTVTGILLSGIAGTNNANNNVVNNITRTGTTGGTTVGIHISNSSGTGNLNANNNTVTNISIDGAGTSSTTYGIQTATGTVSMSNNQVNNISCIKTTGTGLVLGIYNVSSPTNETYNNNTVHTITHNGTGTVGGMAFNTVAGTRTCSGNTIHNITGAGLTVYGMSHTTSSPNVFGNKIYNVQSTSTGAPVVSGILMTSLGASGNGNIYNNLIGDLKAPSASSTGPTAPSVRGINITVTTTTTNIGVFNNSIYLDATSTGANFATAALFATSSATATTASLTLRNNVLVNNSTPAGTGFAVAYQRSSVDLANYNAASNNNAFYAGSPSSSNLLFYDGTNSEQTMSGYQTRVASRDAASFSENISFQNTTASSSDFLKVDLSTATQLESGGARITSPAITTDYFGTIRALETGYAGSGSAPDVGAFEGEMTGLDLVGPTISYTALPNTALTTNRSLNVTITDASGVPTAGIGLPRLYWRRNNGSYSAVTATHSGGSTYNFVFGGGTSAGDTVRYFVAAQDAASAANVSVFPSGGATGITNNPPDAATPPTSPSSYVIATAFSGTYLVGAGETYTSLTDSVGGFFRALNEGGVTGNITVEITSNITESGQNALNQLADDGNGYTLTIRPSAATNRVISSRVANGLIRLNGADKVIIDGRHGGSGRFITIRNMNTANPAITFINGASQNELRHINIEAATTSTSNGAVLFSTGANDNNLISNCHIRDRSDSTARPANGIYFNALTNTNTIIENNDIFDFTTNGINLNLAASTTIRNNRIFHNNSSSVTTIFGILIANANNTSVLANAIYDIRSTATTPAIAGIHYLGVNGTMSAQAINNTIALGTGVTAGTIRGIDYFGWTPNIFEVYHNSIHISGTGVTGSSQTAAFIKRDDANTLNVRNNAFVNTRSNGTGTGNHFAIVISNTVVTTQTLNFNAYFHSGTGGVLGLFNTTNQTTIADWRTASAGDANSINSDPGFQSATDLRPTLGSPVLGAGTPIGTVTTDFAGNARSATAPAIGAYEAGADAQGPQISYTALGNISTFTARTLTASISDVSGVPTSGAGLPVLYWRVNNGSYTSATGAHVSGNNYEFSFGAGVSLADTIRYYLVAQDLASTPNVSAFPAAGASGFSVSPPAAATPPTSPSSYIIVSPPLAGDYNIGVGGDYTTLTAVANDLNIRGVSAAVRLLLIDTAYNTGETYPITFTNIAGISSSNTVSLMPAAGVTTRIASSQTANAIIRLQNISNIIIDGRQGGTGTSQSLTITNSANSGSGHTLLLIDGATNNTIRDVIIGNGGAATAGNACILMSTAATNPSGNSNNLILNNLFEGGRNSVFENGTTSNLNNNNVYEGNTFRNFGFAGFQTANCSNIKIRNNVFTTTTPINTANSGVSIGTTASGTIDITGNRFEDIQNTATTSVRGITASPATGAILNIHNNVFIDNTNNGTKTSVYLLQLAGSNQYTANVHFNSFFLGGTHTGGTSGSIVSIGFIQSNTNASTVVNFRNNAVRSVRTGGDGFHIGAGFASVTGTINANNNVYFSNGGATSFQALWGTTAYNALATYQGVAGTNESTTQFVNPNFVSSTNLRPLSISVLVGNGTPISGITTDFAGATRSLTTPTIGAFEGSVINTWTGTGTWTTSSNWSLGTPASGDHVLIGSGAVEATSAGNTINSITVNSGANVTIPNGASLTVNGALTNNGTFTVQNGGHLLQGASSTIGGSGTFNATRNSGNTSNLVYNMWSSPNSTSTLSNLGGTDWYFFNETSQAWSNTGLTGSSVMSAGRGYSSTGAGNVTFTGTFNNGAVTPAVGTSGQGWNLVGNPYPSSVSGTSFLAGNTNIEGTLWFWSQPTAATVGNSGGDYATWTTLGGTAGSAGGATPDGNIGLAQGFFVKANSGSTISFANSMRSANAGSNFRLAGERAWFNLTGSNNLFNQILLGFSNAASDQRDAADATKLKGNTQIAFYSLLGADQLAIQAMAERGTATRIVPVGFDVATAGAYSLALDRTESMPANVDIFLKDNLTGSMHNLRNQAYGFAVANAGSFTNRFEIHFGVGLATSVNSLTAENVRIFGAGQSLFVQGFAEGTVVERFEVRDAAGRLVMELNRPQNADLERMEMNVAAGVYLARIVTNNGIKTERVYLSK